MGQVVLVTGVAGDLGRRFAAQLSVSPAVERVIGIDVVPPRGDLAQADFVRADIRNPVIAKVIVRERVDTVVHTSVAATPAAAGGRTSMKEHNVIGTMQLLAACQRAPGLERLVVRSSAEVYGASPRDPAKFTEDMGPRRAPGTGFGRDVTEVEAVRRVFGDGAIPKISSTKSLTGHSLGGAGVQEAIYCLLMLQDDFITASANVFDLDPALRPGEIATTRIDAAWLDTVLTNSFGFGGTNATLALSRYHG